MVTQRALADSIRALEMMANNARMSKATRAELRRIAQELREIAERGVRS